MAVITLYFNGTFNSYLIPGELQQKPLWHPHKEQINGLYLVLRQRAPDNSGTVTHEKCVNRKYIL